MPEEAIADAPAQEQPAEQPAVQEESLEDLYKQYPVQDEKAPAAQPAPNVQQQPQPPVEQLPADTDLAAIRKEFSDAKSELMAERQRLVDEANQRDLKDAVAKVQELADINGMDKFVKGYMVEEARARPELMQMWLQRDQDPALWGRALAGLAKDIQKGLSSVANAQLAENQRAMDQSQRGATQSPGKTNTEEDKVMQMSDAQFDNYWLRISNRTS